jgi:hypothetical protein
VGKPLAISSDDIEVVECHSCGGLITVTAPQRPVIVECPSCGAKGEVEKIEEEIQAAPQPVTATDAEFASPTFYLGSDDKAPKPEYGPTLDEEGDETYQPEETETPKEDEDQPSVTIEDRPTTVEYDESMYETKETTQTYEYDDFESKGVMDFSSAKVEGDEQPPEPEVKQPTVSVKQPTVEKTPRPKVSVQPKLKPTVKPKLKPKVKKD